MRKQTTANQHESSAELDALLNATPENDEPENDEPENDEPENQKITDWQSLLDADKDAELLANPLFKGKSIQQLLTELEGAQSLIGRKGLIVPKNEDKPEVWQRFFKQLGRPEKAEDYVLDFADVKESEWYSVELDGHMRGLMHEAGLSSSQAVKISAGFKDFLKAELDDERADQQADDTSQRLSELWGDETETNEIAAERGAKLIGLAPDVADRLLRSADPVKVWDTLAQIGKAQSEHESHGQFDGQGDMSPKDARLELDRLRADKDHVAAFINFSHPQHNQVRALRSKLVRIASS
ncbi:MAG: hypothetical protein ACPGVN_06685 [Alphaproteobacteria bacterium]